MVGPIFRKRKSNVDFHEDLYKRTLRATSFIIASFFLQQRIAPRSLVVSHFRLIPPRSLFRKFGNCRHRTLHSIPQQKIFRLPKKGDTMTIVEDKEPQTTAEAIPEAEEVEPVEAEAASDVDMGEPTEW